MVQQAIVLRMGIFNKPFIVQGVKYNAGMTPRISCVQKHVRFCTPLSTIVDTYTLRRTPARSIDVKQTQKGGTDLARSVHRFPLSVVSGFLLSGMLSLCF